MNRRDFLRLAACGAGLTAAGRFARTDQPAKTDAKRPNFLFITADDMNYDTPDCTASPTTPSTRPTSRKCAATCWPG